MKCLILTVEQARNLQQEHKAEQHLESKWEWPGNWKSIYDTQLPDTVDNLPDPDRTSAALQMMAMGCADDQVAEQLMWRPKGSMLKATRKLYSARR